MPESLHPGVYVQQQPTGATPIEGASTSTTAFVGATALGPAGTPTFITSWFQFKDSFGGPCEGCALPLAVFQYFQNGGTRAYIVRVVNEERTPPDDVAALKMLDRLEDVSLLCIPGADAATAAAGIHYVAQRPLGDLFYIVDSPKPTTSAASDAIIEVKSFLAALADTSSSAGLYFPWVEVPDPCSTVSGATCLAPPSGMVAGLFARTDSSRGVWKAPAGSEASLLGCVGLACEISDAEQEELNPLGINCIRQFAASGIVVWGARTLATMSNPEFRYVPVRRFANFLKVSLFCGTQWVVFEPNDEPLWSAIRFQLNAFMTSLFRAGALEGEKPEDAFFVRCDRDNNVQATIDQGQVHILVAFAPLKPSEFVVLHIQQQRSAPLA